MRNAIYFVSVVALFLIVPSSAPAQIQIGTVSGTVTDPVGALLPGATVMLSNPITGYSNVATTDQSGEFIFNNVISRITTCTSKLLDFRPVCLM